MPRYSPQREAILDCVTKHGGHCTVDEIFRRAITRMPKLSRATVYRNLQQLEEMQQVCSFVGPNQVTYYEIYSEPHHHFVCTKCDRIDNIFEPDVHLCVKCIGGKSQRKIDQVITTLFGVCEDCV